MKQQFIGLKHCKCGMSWKRDIGYFERTEDMVFALEKRKCGKKWKQMPVIRYKQIESLETRGRDIRKYETEEMDYYSGTIVLFYSSPLCRICK